jgi:hypothetical protein
MAVDRRRKEGRATVRRRDNRRKGDTARRKDNRRRAAIGRRRGSRKAAPIIRRRASLPKDIRKAIRNMFRP